MPELRKDPVTRRWVIVNPESLRAHPRFQVPHDPPRTVNGCPFCRGGEPDTLNEILAYRDEGLPPNSPEWTVRVMPNKFPALRIEGEFVKAGVGMYDRMTGIGAHEVIVETPSHEASLATLECDEIERVLGAYRERLEDLRQDSRFKYALIFKNWGRAAGASLEHCHSQLIATPVVPKLVLEEISGCENYFQFKERCVYCDIIRQELATGERICRQTRYFVALAPFASRFPFELTLIPKEHESDYTQITPEQTADLARLLRDVLIGYRNVLDDPPYNYILHTLPLQHAPSEAYHWHIEILPRLSRTVGFEWGSGFYINPTPPEEATRLLQAGMPPGEP
ncbi:MAG: galactose-1-phosphate uridylyltransferase [Candidatus Riflebacteria bacterium]|nr:galactose-1-phosphate uridylyltransferase [Candidatus Riflebacteria bacterium]